ncbi:hypothetical protein CD110_12375 [Staphylococcus casei]|uniref:hypothetical protein n=1 Tax=Staphylococcus TaxID=1279 RepID=UPI000CD0A49B|nr:hypothetical protein [Staphylococcus casei]PNZ57214.1 hypothetical protein CD110_12375 [Staphylococcus casei]PTI75797.1 hypothetical protein BU064_11225 [Staphylococcus succinus]WJE86329.1 hypothetical protein QMO72_13205 [Staphylococcus casei]
MKKIITKKHVFLIDEKESIGNDDCVYGKSLLLSIYVHVNTKTKGKTGSFIYSEFVGRIVRHDDVVAIEDLTDKEIEFFEYVKKRKEVPYSKKIVEEYDVEKYIIYVDVQAKVNEMKN